MSKPIKITDEIRDKLIREFRNSILKSKLSDGKISYNASLDMKDEKATLLFTEKAYMKMQGLISHFDKEVGWHGIATRTGNENEYLISDILVYPQTVTGATVTTDQVKYQEWLISHDIEVFNNIRMQGHSHVNMGVTPSGVDLALYDNILNQLTDDMFYIFMIWNKRGEKTIKIYDMLTNTLFENNDVTIDVVNEVVGLNEFIKHADSLVKVEQYTYKKYTPPASEPKQQVYISKNKTEVIKPKKEKVSPEDVDEKFFDEFYDCLYDELYGGYYD